MFEYMDEIVERVKGFAEDAAEIAGEIFIITAKVLILITTPAWILPYVILRDNNGGRCEMPDCENCPFPPCEKKE